MTLGETPSQPETPQSTPSVQSSTVQVLVANEGNRRAICEMLTDEFDVETSPSIQEADLYLVEDRLLSKHRDELRERVFHSHPVFCPVVIIQRDRTHLDVDWTASHETGRESGSETETEGETPLLIDEFVEAPINKQLLVSRLRSLLVRRQQSLALQTQVETLERQERELRRFKHAVEDSGTATAITDTDGLIEYVNTEFEELTGYTESDVLGNSLKRFLAEESRGVIGESFWRTIVDEQEWDGELLVERKDEKRRITDTAITPITDGTEAVEGFVVVMPDITQRVEQEQLLRDREEELDLLRQILSRYLRHNLRNDLGVIRGYAELLEETLSEQGAQDATKILDTTNRLIKTSEEARKYSTLIERGSGFSRRDLSAMVEDVVSTVRTRYPDVSFDVDVPNECNVLARDELREGIHNLIDNAALHNTADAPWVRVTVTDTDGVRVVIEDNGPGLPELERETLARGSEAPLRHSQGLGLWLSKWVIERSNGELSFETIEDGGTRVTADFPSIDHVGTQDLAVSDLKAREQRLKTITQRMTDAVIEVNAAWEITFVDEQAGKILGIDADTIRGQHFWDTFPEIRDTRSETVYRDVMQSRSAERIEAYYAGIDGWLEVYVYPDFDGGLSFYFRDVTDRKEREQELERAHERMELALGVTDATVWEWDLETDVVTVHPERHPVLEKNVQTVDDFLEGIHPDDISRVREALATAVETGSPYDVEFRVQTDGELRWVADYGEVQYDADGDAKRMVGTARDITERKQREQELAQQRALLDRTERIADVGGWEIDTETMDVFWSDSLYEILGVDDHVAQSLDEALDLYHEDDRDIVENAVETALDTGEPFDVEARIRRPDGEIRWLQIQGEPTMEDGTVVTLRGAVQDITEQKQREQDLKEEQQFIKSIFDALPDPLYAFDTEGTLLRWNDQLEAVTGYSSEELTDRTVTDLVPEAEADRIDTLFRKILDGRRSVTVESALETKPGEQIPYEFTGGVLEDADGTVRGVTGVGRDLTERRKRKAELELKSRAMDEAPTGITITDASREDNPIIYANEQFERLTGYPEADVLGRNCRFLQGENTAAEQVSEMREAITAGEPVTVELRNYRKDGTEFWNRVSIAPVRTDGAEITHFVGFQQDVTDKKERQRLLKSVFNNAYTLTGVMDLDGTLREANETALSFAELEREDVVGKPIWESYWFQENQHARETARKAVTQARQGELFRDEIRVQGKDDVMIIDFTVRPVLDEEGAVTLLIPEGRDITDLKERERALEERVKELTAIQQTAHTFLQSDASLDELFDDFIQELPQAFQYPDITAGKITYRHYEASSADFEPRENSLRANVDLETGGSVRIEVVYLEERPPEDDGPFLTEEQHLLDTLAVLIGSYVERWEYTRQLERKNEQLESFTSIVSHDLRTPLNVAQGRLELVNEEYQSEDIERIKAAHDRIEALVEDMLTLARSGDSVGETEPVVLSDVVESCWRTVEATEATLRIETEQRIYADESRLQQLLENLFRNAVEHGGDSVTITVGALDDGFYIADDGPGIPVADRETVFESGYSTSNDGTGFGLSIVREIVEAHGWEVRITESDSGGARFEITGVEFVTE